MFREDKTTYQIFLLASSDLKVGVQMIIKMQRASTSLDVESFGPNKCFFGTWYASVCCAFQVDLIKWDPNLWTFEELELVKQAVQLLAIFCKLVRHDPKSSWQLASPNPWVELKSITRAIASHTSRMQWMHSTYEHVCWWRIWWQLKFVPHQPFDASWNLINTWMMNWFRSWWHLFLYISLYNFFTLPVSTNLTRPTLLYKIERREKNIYVW